MEKPLTSFRIDTIQTAEYPTVVEIWEASVRATHHFITEADIQFFRPLILNEYLGQVSLWAGRDENGDIAGFIGIAGDSIEMLFVHPSAMGKGLGKKLLHFAVKGFKVWKVEVNEQNEAALGFYRHMGFEVVGRLERDGMGKPYPILQMEKKPFRLRPWTADDLESLVEQANNFKVARYLTDGFPHPYTPEAGKRFISYATSGEPIHIFAIEVEGKAVGGIGIHPQSDIMRKNAELGYWLGEAYWGRGIITAAVREMVDFGFRTFDITRIYARPFGNNPASQRVLEKAGFRLEARIEKNIFKNEEFLDELIYAVRREGRLGDWEAG